ncbi:S9 family peptidase [Plantactinospora soyae]|uniref:Dipeptidyl aminopeptidase/acylaminoacyl peptidase n=1 Tax=Plantactinospora soyae TaxID=1544732 RepID=A0A927MDE5_9ACTN|nr:S9 family peptidase [Plantactinospora soyae]MBE1491066.1 dipeptidyl aminopeptidase/acylaminoacyl peptidase [Plantactinospora soyae]
MKPPDLIPRSVLFANPARLSPALSPSGKHIAYLAPVNGVLNIWVGESDGVDYRPVTEDSDRGINAFFWAHDGRHLMYLQDRNGDENMHLYAVDIDSGQARELTPFPGVKAGLAGLSRRVPGHVLVTMNRRTRHRYDVYRIEIATGELVLVAENEGFAGWLTDRDLRVRGALVWDGDGARLMVRDDERTPWRPLHGVGLEDAMKMRPLGFTADGESVLLLSSADANAIRLLRLGLAGEVEVVYADPRHDVVNVHVRPDTGQPDLVVVRRERSHLEVLDPRAADDVARLRDICRGDVTLLGRDDTDRWWLTQDNIDDGPAGYHLFDRTSGKARFLFSHQPELERYELARMEPFSFLARDGLTIHGYLTFPPGHLRRGLPTVLTVHGGPWARDVWGFRAEPQWLANRGYLCIQVNYRGSTGYGKDFTDAGDREWGGRMQDDLTDAVHWAVQRGYADPDRVAIYGASYGGYAALAGAAFTPELFRCAVSAAGPSDLRTFIGAGSYARVIAAQMRRRVGDPDLDADFLWLRSPLSRVDEIRIPLLIAQGANDPRVRREQSEQLVAALREKEIPHQYLLFPDEGHALVRPRNRLAFYTAVERFLAEHLGGRCEATPTEDEGPS